MAMYLLCKVLLCKILFTARCDKFQDSNLLGNILLKSSFTAFMFNRMQQFNDYELRWMVGSLFIFAGLIQYATMISNVFYWATLKI